MLSGCFQVKEGEGAQPAVVHETPLLKLWHKACVHFETPKAVIYLHFACPEVRLLSSLCPAVRRARWPMHAISLALLEAVQKGLHAKTLSACLQPQVTQYRTRIGS